MTLLIQAKKDGFADRYLAQLLGLPRRPDPGTARLALGMAAGLGAVPVSGVENAAYYYSTYNAPDQVEVSDRRKIMVLGGGPNRIGQGIEFDYCCVHAAFALRDEGYESIMVNCNPETVSTDYDTSDKLYFEPLTVEDVLSIYEKEKPEGVIVQFGGQTPLNIADELAAGRGQDPRHLARYHRPGRGPGPFPADDAPSWASPCRNRAWPATWRRPWRWPARIGYPLMVRPSYVLGGRGMEVVHDEEMLRHYVAAAVDVTPGAAHPHRQVPGKRHRGRGRRHLPTATDAFVPAVMEHIELAGIHSGDSACVIPPISIPAKHLDTIYEYTRKIAMELKVVGLMNIQYAIADDTVYILEANPRASRTVPLVSKVCNIPMARLATQVMLGKKLADLNLQPKSIPHFGVKEAVFPFNMFPEVDPLLGPEMRSTGEVLGMADSFGLAFYKAQEAAKQTLPCEGTVLITVSENDRPGVLEVARQFADLGFKIRATQGTHKFLTEQGIQSEPILKMHEGRPNIVDAIKNGEIHWSSTPPAAN